jgi:hypothetical protein
MDDAQGNRRDTAEMTCPALSLGNETNEST